MILVFGGTTEGRRAVEVLEEAGALYYYSTRSDGQQIELVNGVHLTGGMDVPQMVDCCREHAIRLIVDAAHPFAEELHRNLLFVAQHIGAPIIRYDRIYPPREADLVWCKDYDEAIRRLEEHHIDRLLALTGVNTIWKLRPYWQQHDCWFRILSRRVSKVIARQAQFPEERLVYYETDDTATLISDLHPEAIITKESGLSGGFTEKVEAARRAGIKVFVIERPEYPPHTPNPQNVHIEFVNGPHGLRRTVEHLLPEFFPLKSGLTTGTCAAAAAVAATLQLSGPLGYAAWLVQERFQALQQRPTTVPVILPDGETIHVSVGYGDGYAYCVKEAGDDPDVTDGIEIRASVEPSDHFGILGGEGVGRFTLPGFDFPPGEPAINKGPREMIRRNLEQFTIHNSQFTITISVPGGEEIARRTFNPRLGIEGGISIIGVSGIVKPFSEEAFIDSIRKCMEVAKASFSGQRFQALQTSGGLQRSEALPTTARVVLGSGAKSERFVKALYPDLPAQAFVQYGNYIGETLKIAADLAIPNVTLGVMLGKAVKLAAGHLDTHSRKTVMDKAFIQQMLHESGISIDISDMTLARELWERIAEDGRTTFAHTVIQHCHEHCAPLLPNGELLVLLIDDNGKIFRV